MTIPYNSFDEFEQALQESKEAEGSGGGSALCAVEVAFGYPVFAAGLTAEERFFPAPVGKSYKAEQEKAKAAAIALAQEYDVDPNTVRFSLQILLRADGALKVKEGEVVAAEWNGDMSEIAPLWTLNTDQPSALKDLHIPAMRKCNVMHDWKGWAKIGFARDPYKASLGDAGMTDEDLDGNPRYPIVRYILETYPDKEAAYAAYQSEGVADVGAPAATAEVSSSVPQGYSPEGWANMIPAIKKQLADGDTPAAVAQAFGVQVSDITALM